MSSKVLKNTNKTEKKNNKSKNIVLIILFILVGIVFFFIGINSKNLFNTRFKQVQNEYNYILDECESESKKYDQIIANDSIKDIYKYLSINIDNSVLYKTPVMDYIFSELYPKGTAEEKYNLFYLYYFNMLCLEKEYSDYFQVNTNLQWLNLNYNGYDLNSLEDISKIDNSMMKDILINMNVDGLTIINNYPSMEAVMDYDLFLDKFRNILDDEYIKYCELLGDSQEIILNPGGQGFNYLGELWYLHNFESFIRNTNNIHLKGAAQGIYEQNLALFFGQYEPQLFYSDMTNYVVDDNFIIAATNYIELYPDDYTSQLCTQVLELVNSTKGDNEDIVDTIAFYISSFVDNAEWLPLDSTTNDNQEVTEWEDEY